MIKHHTSDTVSCLTLLGLFGTFLLTEAEFSKMNGFFCVNF